MGKYWSWSPWWLERMEEMQGAGGGKSGGDGLRFSLQFDPGKVRFDRTLLGLPVSALLGQLLGWSKNGGQRRPEGSMVITEGGGEPTAAVAVVASAFAVYLVAMHVSDQQPRRRRRLAGPNSEARRRALPDGLLILSSGSDESLENVIHGTSVGAGDAEPVLVPRVRIDPADMAGENAHGEAEHADPVLVARIDPAHMVGANAHGEAERDEPEEEDEAGVDTFKELWQSLEEREQRLELQLMELAGAREQEAAVRELESRVAVAAVEARMLELRASSLKEENERLEAQVAELDAVKANLALAKAKVIALKATVEREQEEAQREAAALRERVAELEENGGERERALAALRQANAALEEENKELALRLREAEQEPSSVNLVLQDDVAEEANQLRETNEKLTRQIEQLHCDHCARVGELVYLKWVNACLRHELHRDDHDDHDNHDNHDNLSPGQDQEEEHDYCSLSAMNLSKSMSYRSSEKAKQLMLQYGNLGLDPALFSPLHESLYGDGNDDYEHHPAMGGVAAAVAAAAAPAKRPGHGGKLKFLGLGSIKKMLVGTKWGHGHGDRKSKNAPPPPPPPQPRDEHFEKTVRWLSSNHALGVVGGDDSYESTPLSSSSRTPPSSATTASHPRGGREATAPAARLQEPKTTTSTRTRSRSDVDASYPCEARPDDGHRTLPPEKRRGARRHSEELRIPDAVARAEEDA